MKKPMKRYLEMVLVLVMCFLCYGTSTALAEDESGKNYTLKITLPSGEEEVVDHFDRFEDCIATMDINDSDSLYTIYVNRDTVIPADDLDTDRSSNKIRLTSGEGGPYKLTRKTERPLIHLSDNAVLTIDHLTLDGDGEGALTYLNTSDDNNEGAKLILDEGAVIQNFGTDQYSTIYIEEGEAIIKDGAMIKENHITAEGKSLIFIYNTGKITIEGGEFSNNSTNYFGGLILSYGTVDIQGGTFKNNQSKYDGGVLAAYGGQTNITGGVFEGNSARIGGAISAKTSIDIKDAVFKNNKSKGGGAIYVGKGTLSLSGTRLDGNSAVYGGALASDSEDQTIISNHSTFKNNQAQEDGGAIYVEPYEYALNITKKKAYQNIKTDATTLFQGNTAGGGLFNPPENFKDFVNLKFDDRSDVTHGVLSSKSLLNNYDVNYKNEAWTITFDPNGGTGTMPSVKIGQGASYTLPECGFTAPEGKTFKAWEIDGKEYDPGDKITVNSDKTVKALWDGDTDSSHPSNPKPGDDDKMVTITFDPNGGILNDPTSNGQKGTAPIVMRVTVGDVITIIDAPTREGYTFLYWKGSEHHPGDKYTVTGPHTFTAVWEKEEEKPDTPDKPDKPDEPGTDPYPSVPILPPGTELKPSIPIIPQAGAGR